MREFIPASTSHPHAETHRIFSARFLWRKVGRPKAGLNARWILTRIPSEPFPAPSWQQSGDEAMRMNVPCNALTGASISLLPGCLQANQAL
jgi:hypothetical protein